MEYVLESKNCIVQYLDIGRFLHLAIKYAIMWEYIIYNPCDGVKAPGQAKTEMVIPAHGQPMEGRDLARHLDLLLADFSSIARPEQGRFIDREHSNPTLGGH